MFNNLKVSEPRNLMTVMIFGTVMLLVVVITISSFVVVGKLVLDRMNDPIVSYYGELMRKSQLEVQTNGSFHCMTLNSSTSDAEWICFDTMQELDAYIAAHPR